MVIEALVKLMHGHSLGGQVKWLEKTYKATASIPNEYIGNFPARVHRTSDAIRDFMRIKRELKNSQIDLKLQERKIKLQVSKIKSFEKKSRQDIFFNKGEFENERMSHSKRMSEHAHITRELNIQDDELQILKDELSTMKSDASEIKTLHRHAEKHLKKMYKLLRQESRYVKKRVFETVQHKAKENIIFSIRAKQEHVAHLNNQNSQDTQTVQDNYREEVQKAYAKWKKATSPRDFLEFLSEKDKEQFKRIIKQFEIVEHEASIFESYL